MCNLKPSIAVWEVTMGCNMRCKHCGSSCTSSLPGELTTEEALDLCDQLAALGFEYVNLSGGEPLLRKDWDQIAERLTIHGVGPLMISNGWFVDDATAKRIHEVGVGKFAISLDGLKHTHDYMRCEGSYDRVMSALRTLDNNGVHTAIITTINKRNLPELIKMKDILIAQGVGTWQLQIATPMGSFHGHKEELMLEPEQLNDIIDFAYEAKDEIGVCLGDCIGYYSKKAHEISKTFFQSENAVWQGCHAGKRSLGILHNGDIIGCNSIRDPEFIEGNIREKSLKDIWETGFAWNREMSREKFEGFCLDCQYADTCLGGCPNVRLCLNGGIANANTYCVYHDMVIRSFNAIFTPEISYDGMIRGIEVALKDQNYNLIIMLIQAYREENKALSEIQDLYLLNSLHYAYFRVGRFKRAKEVCEEVLTVKNDESYALHGLAINLYYMGETEEAFNVLNVLERISVPRFKETVNDLCIATLDHKEEDLMNLKALAVKYEIAV